MLIKNYNLSQFVADMDQTWQQIILYLTNRTKANIFGAYMIDFTWKIVQVKLALMVRQLNYKVVKDLEDKEAQHKYEFDRMQASYELQIADLKRTIETKE